jgi:hypothetical protein
MTYEYVKNGILISFIIILITAVIILSVRYSIKEYYLQDDPILHKIKKLLDPLHPEIKDLKLYKGLKSYTINKEKIYLCLTDENDEYYSMNMLIYVFLHEFSHYLNKDDIGHTPKFYKIFEDILNKASDMGLYDSSMSPNNDYCKHN